MTLSRFALLGLIVSSLGAQPRSHPTETPAPSSRVLQQIWDAEWIMPPGQPARVYGVYHFRKDFELNDVPATFVVNVSADNRYRLFANGHPVNIDTLDLAPWLQVGRNVIAAKVWNFAEHGPVAQETDQTAFILQGNSAAEAAVNTDASWRAFTNAAYAPINDAPSRLWTYIVVGPGDDVDAAHYPWGWEQNDFDDSGWASALTLRKGTPKGMGTDARWPLVPRQIPLMEEWDQRLARVRRTRGVEVPAGFLEGGQPAVIPAHTEAVILVDQDFHTTAFPELTVSGGAGSKITVTYAESLYEGTPHPSSKTKGHRDEVAGKFVLGYRDIFRPDGERRTFRPLRWRTYRYIEITVATAETPLTLEDLTGEFTAYPLAENATFKTDDPTLEQIWEVAWRTIRTGTHEIFTDSPYYEQLSYVGDTRIEALISIWVDGDDRMMRKSIDAFGDRRNANGLTTSRWPDSRHQIIPPYSLVWISMVHDFWSLRDDPEFVRQQLPAVREVLRYFDEHSDPQTGSYRVSEWWNFVDWIEEWGTDNITGLGGVPPLDAQRNSAIIDLQHVYTLQQAAELMSALGDEHYAEIYRERAQRIRSHVKDSSWSTERRMLADNSRQETFSQHANAFWILTAEEASPDFTELAQRVLQSADVTPATFYFQFYTHEAWRRSGLGNDYSEWLNPWRGVIEQGLTSVPETPASDTRSDSHAWGAHPLLGMLNTVAGIQSAEAGFGRVLIQPHFGNLHEIKASVPHPRGTIEVALTLKDDDGLMGWISLPMGLNGEFEWQEERIELVPGRQEISL